MTCEQSTGFGWDSLFWSTKIWICEVKKFFLHFSIRSMIISLLINNIWTITLIETLWWVASLCVTLMYELRLLVYIFLSYFNLLVIDKIIWVFYYFLWFSVETMFFVGERTHLWIRIICEDSQTTNMPSHSIIHCLTLTHKHTHSQRCINFEGLRRMEYISVLQMFSDGSDIPFLKAEIHF